ncbi:MAG: YhcH/YjgK/YiaL family protein [Tepidisphaeraceae bacterium]
MIHDQLRRASAYRSLSANFAIAFDYLLKTDLLAQADGKVAVAGEAVFAIYQQYDAKPVEAGRWESHERYADIQVILAGEELMGFRDINGMTVATPFDKVKDVAFWQGPVTLGQALIVRANEFTVFFPHDVHMPSLATEKPQHVRKVVMKVEV